MIILSSAGFFGTKNFDPLVGDSVKVFYYSFFVLLSYIFLISEVFRRIKLGRVFFLIIFNFLFLFLIGFPFSYSDETINDINYKNSTLPLCEINEPIIKNLFFLDNSDLDCKKDFQEIDKFNPVTVIDENKIILNFSSIPIFNILMMIFLSLISTTNNFNFPFNKKDAQIG